MLETTGKHQHLPQPTLKYVAVARMEDRYRYFARKLGQSRASPLRYLLERERLRASSGTRIVACGSGGFVLTYSDGKRSKHSKRLCGAHRTLKEFVWNASARHRPHKAMKRHGPRGPLVFSDGRAYHGATAGLERGKYVHTQLQAYATLPWKRFQAMYPTVDPLTKAAIKHLRDAMHVTPVDAEYLVFDAVSGVGTAIDLVCITNNGPPALVLVEIKTGYSGAFTSASGRFRAKSPLAGADDTPLNRARTQLLLSKSLFEYGDAQKCRSQACPPIKMAIVQVEDGKGAAERAYVRSFGMESIRGSLAFMQYIRAQKSNATPLL